jgi:serine/threonine protein phosphatase PrpC
MKCPNCGQENRDVAHFCQYCGHHLMAAEAEQPEPLLDVAEIAVVEADEEQLVDLEASITAPELEQQAEQAMEEAMDEETAPVDFEWDESETETAVQVEQETETEPAELESETGTSVEPEIETTVEPEVIEVETAVAHAEKDARAERVPDEAETVIDVRVAAPESPTDEFVLEAEVEEAEPSMKREAQADATQDEEMIGQPLEETEDQETLVPLEVEQEPLEAEYGAEMQELTDAGFLPWRDEAVSAENLVAGTIVQERYRVVEVLGTGTGETLYRVRDLRRCPQCGSTGNSPDEAFCISCGAVLDEKPLATMLERPIASSGLPVEAEVEDQFTEGDRAYWVWRETVKQEDEWEAGPPMYPIVGQKSDTGMVRELDEDGLFVLTMARTFESMQDTIALFVVADGMGGHEGGEVASKIAIQTLANIMFHNVFIPELEGIDLSSEEIQDWMQKAGQVANDQVYLERQKRQNDMGTTLTAAFVKNWTLYLAHIGDCRAYRWSEAGLEQLTTDHSVIASMVAAGTAAPEEIYTHPQRSVIYRCVGDQPSVEVDTSVLPVQPGDRLVLCCDGLWEMLRNEGIEDILLREPDPQQACEVMVEQANLAGGTDNISVLVVQL